MYRWLHSLPNQDCSFGSYPTSFLTTSGEFGFTPVGLIGSFETDRQDEAVKVTHSVWYAVKDVAVVFVAEAV